MSDFDPYLHWLGIQPHEQPADHYRLLGLRRFEADPVAIQSAADERMALVRVYQTGPRGHFTQKLLNELATAKLCLLDPFSRAEYDAALSVTMPGTAPVADSMLPASVPAPVPLAASSSPPRVNTTGTAIVTHRYAPHSVGWPAWGILAVVVIGLMVCVAMIVLDRRPTHADNPSVKKSKDVKVAIVPAVEDEHEPAHDSGLITQDANGLVVFPMSAASLRGQTALESQDIGEFLMGWQTEDDQASWRFQIRKLPSQGIFRVRVIYQASGTAGGASYVLDLDGTEQTQDVRAHNRLVEDEFYLAVKRAGEHTLTFSIRNLPANATIGLKLLECSIPRIDHTGGESSS